jgi:hypothetical protein
MCINSLYDEWISVRWFSIIMIQKNDLNIATYVRKVMGLDDVLASTFQDRVVHALY